MVSHAIIATEAFCCGLPGAMKCQSTPLRLTRRSTAREVISEPLRGQGRTRFADRIGKSRLSLTISRGGPRQATRTSSSRASLAPDLWLRQTRDDLPLQFLRPAATIAPRLLGVR